METQQINIEGKNLNVTIAPWNSSKFDLTGFDSLPGA